MADIENIVLEHLKAIRAEIHEMRRDQQETRTRVSILEQQGASVLREIANLYEQGAANSLRLDRIADAIVRIEKRLELVD